MNKELQKITELDIGKNISLPMAIEKINKLVRNYELLRQIEEAKTKLVGQ